MIDTQLHIVDPDRFPFPPRSGGYVPRDDECGDAAALLDVLNAHGITHGVLVQASVYGTDNAAILAAAQGAPDRFRVVAMAGAGDVAAMAAHPLVAGIRLNLTDYDAHGDKTVARRLAAEVLDHGLILQVQAMPEATADLLSGLPDGPVILDHFGRPDLRRAADFRAISQLADRKGCVLKVSGAFRLRGLDPGTRPDPRLAGLVRAFGPGRLIWGSDWPFLNLSARRPAYADCLATGCDLIDMDDAARTARALFGWGDG